MRFTPDVFHPPVDDADEYPTCTRLGNLLGDLRDLLLRFENGHSPYSLVGLQLWMRVTALRDLAMAARRELERPTYGVGLDLALSAAELLMEASASLFVETLAVSRVRGPARAMLALIRRRAGFVTETLSGVTVGRGPARTRWQDRDPLEAASNRHIRALERLAVVVPSRDRANILETSRDLLHRDARTPRESLRVVVHLAATMLAGGLAQRLHVHSRTIAWSTATIGVIAAVFQFVGLTLGTWGAILLVVIVVSATSATTWLTDEYDRHRRRPFQ